MTLKKSNFSQGYVDKQVIVIVCLSVFGVVVLGLGIWSFVNYINEKTNVNGKIDQAVATAKKDQADSDAAKFLAQEKQPNREFVGPDDYGRLTFNYPKTWSVYINKDITTQGGPYEAYLNPVSVPAVSPTQQYALRVTIDQLDYNQAIASYSSLVKNGSLQSSSVVAANGVDGTRFDGNFTKDIRGSAVVFKIRDKTLTLRTDANTFLPDFNALVATVKFNQ